MGITAKINGVTYVPEVGSVFEDEYNEKLDSGLIIIKDFSQHDFEPFDVVEISGGSLYGRRLLIDTVDEDKICFSPERYTYTITLFSETKGLERVTLPNLAITQSLVGDKKSVWYYFQNYVTYYSPQIKVANLGGSGWHYEARYSIDSAVQTLLASVDCSELQWNSPTLREVLDDLLGIVNCIVVVKNNIISYYKITEIGNAIDTTKLNHTKRNMTSADYASDLHITMKNGIGNNPVKRTEYIGFRSTTGELTTDNMKIITQRPIDLITSCIIGYTLTNSSTGAIYYYENDITMAIKEKKAWDVLSASVFYDYADFVPAKFNTHRQANAYYERGSNVIGGWGDLYKKLGATNSILTTIVRCVASPVAVLDNLTNERDVYFKLTYNTADEATMKIGKTLPMRHGDNNLFDNQENSYIDMKQQSIYQYLKVNRLGNRLKTIYAKYDNETDIPLLGDYIGNDILFSRKIQVYGNAIKFEGKLTAHYILSDWFTSVKSKRRSWQLAEKSDALTRQDVTKNYAEFSFRRKDDELSYGATDYATYFATGLQTKLNVRPLAYCLVYTYDSEYMRYPDYEAGSGYQMDCLANVYGNSLEFSFGFNDNYAVDSHIVKNDTAYVNNIYPYCDNNGEHIGLRVKYLTYIDPSDNEFEWLPSGTKVYGGATDDPRYQAQIDKSRIRPLILDYNNDYTRIDLITNKYKDNREIEKHISQFEFCSDTPNIIFGKQLLENQEAVLRTGNVDLSGATIKCLFDLTVHANAELSTPPTTEMGETQAIRITGRLFLVGTIVNIYYPVYDEINSVWEWDNNVVASESWIYSIFTEYHLEYYWADFTETTSATFTQYRNNYYIFRSNAFTYRMSDTTPKGSLYSGGTYTLTKISNNVLRIVRSSLPSDTVSWAIVDNTGKLLIGVNGNATTIYLNMLRIRDNNVYGDNVSQIVVGDMQDGTYEVGSSPAPLPEIYIRRRVATSSVVNPDIADTGIDHSGT